MVLIVADRTNVLPFLQGFRVAYVVFKNPAGIQAVKSLSLQGPLVMSSESRPVKTGIRSKSPMCSSDLLGEVGVSEWCLILAVPHPISVPSQLCAKGAITPQH